MRGLSPRQASDLLFVGLAPCSAAVAAEGVLRSAVLGSVVVVMAEIPRLIGRNEFPASPAFDRAGCYARRPSAAELVVAVVVPALLTSSTQSFTLCPVLLTPVALLGWDQVGASGFGADTHAGTPVSRWQDSNLRSSS